MEIKKYYDVVYSLEDGYDLGLLQAEIVFNFSDVDSVKDEYLKLMRIIDNRILDAERSTLSREFINTLESNNCQLLDNYNILTKIL